MEEAAKHRCDVLLALCDRAWEQFNERRKYEMQVSLAFWTALALAVAGSFQLSAPIPFQGGRWALLAVCIVIVALNMWWHYGVWTSNKRDRARAVDYQEAIHEVVGFQYSKSTVKLLASSLPGMTSLAKNWSHSFQILLTVLLASILVLSNWHRFGTRPIEPPSPAQRLAVSRDSLALQADQVRLYLLRLDSARAAHEVLSPPARPRK